MQSMEEQLDANEEQDDAQAVRQVHQAVQQPVDEEEHLAQAHQRECVRREHQERLRGDAVDGRDGVEGKHDVDQPDSCQRHKQRGEGELALLLPRLLAVGQLVPVVARGDVNDLAQPLDDEHVIGVGLWGIVDLIDEQLHCGVDEEDSEEVEHVRPRRDDGCAEHDEDQAEDQRQHNTDEQHLLLVLPWDLERRHDEREDEQVIHTQRLLGDPTGVELRGVLVIPEHPHHPAKDEGDHHVENGPARGLLDGGLMRGADVAIEIENKEAQYHHDGDGPDPDRYMHGALSLRSA